MKKRPRIIQKAKSLLQKEISSICPFCGNEDVDHFHFHHIDENPENNDMLNLLMLCPICHSKITKGDITREDVERKKRDISTNQKDVLLFFQEIAPLIFDLIIFGEQEKDRSINPWVSRLESRYSEISKELRRLAIKDVSIQKGWTVLLDESANSIDNFVGREVCLYRGLTEDIKDAVEKAKHIKVSIVDPFFASQRVSLTLKKDFAMQIRMLKSLNDRAETMLNEGKIEELQGNASKIGHDLLILSMYDTEDFPKAVKEKLYSISREIHLMETKRNNHSFDRQELFRNRLSELSGQLNALAVELPNVTREN
ncbi:HNH endonuclease [Desulfobulbus sp. F5]|nr:HNH endonuclease [Desulfobulbus sp. F5]